MKTTLSEVHRLQSEGRGAWRLCMVVGALVSFMAAHGLLAQPVIPSTQPSNQVACLGGCLAYSVEATGTPPLSYEWRVYTNLLAYGVVPGETASTIVLCNVPTNNYRLRVVVKDGGGLSSTSRLALMNIVLPPSITHQAIGGSALIGQSFTQSVTASGNSPSYQWHFEGQPLLGKTASSLVISSVQLTNAGDYHVVISNACGTTNSETNRLTVTQDTTFTRITTGPLVTDLGNSWAARFGDYNGDGFQDIFVIRYLSGRSCLYRNNGDGTFTGVTNNVFPVSQANYTGGNWADIDNDGRLDLHVVDYSGALPSFFALNNGDGSFTKMELGSVPTWSVSLVDTDSDGLLDMFFARGFNSNETTRFYRNLDGRNFRQVTPAEVGDLLSPVGTAGNPAWVDYDDDGWVDMFGPSFRNLSGVEFGRCQMYHNDGTGRFVSMTNQITQDGISGAIGVWGDYDNDGRVDLFVGAISGPSTIYRNLGSGRFEKASIGVTLPDGAMLARWGDYDNDGFLDLVANPVSPIRGCALFRNSGNGTFTRITTGPIVTSSPSPTQSYDAGWLDYDNDGFLDLFVSNGEDSGVPSVMNFLHHNTGNNNAWLKVKLVGTLSNRDAVGAKVRVEADFWGKHRWQRRDFAAGEYGGVNNNPIAHFGLGDATNVETLRIEWPSGAVQTLSNVAPRQFLTITEEPQPRIETQPVDLTRCQGDTATFSVTATGARPLTYQWRYYVTGSFFTNMPGEVNASLVLENVQPVSGRFAVLVSNASGSVTSRLAKVNVILPPSITQQAIGGSALIGQSFTQSVTASGLPLYYQWYFNGLPMVGKTAASLVIPNVQSINGGVYYVVVSNTCRTVTSETNRLTVGPDATFTRIMTGPLATDQGNSFVANIGDYDGDNYVDVFVARWNLGRSSLYRNNGDGTFSSITNGLFPLSQDYDGFGVIWSDLDNDGRRDVIGINNYLITNHPSFLAFNNGDGSFTKSDFGDLSAWNLNAADVNGDGFLDLYLVTGWPAPVVSNHLYRNLDGRNLQPIARTDAGELLEPPFAWRNVSWADYDDDGQLDVFAASGTNGFHRQMFHNEGGGRFGSVTNRVTLDAINSVSSAWGDYDNDGRLDLCVVAFAWSDFSGWTSLLYRNLGGGQFERASIGLDLGAGTIATWGDYDNDGFMDLLTTKARDRGCSLFRNSGNGTFSRITTGPLVTTAPSASEAWCYTANWFDYDNDGFLDVFVANGRDDPVATVANYLYHNGGNTNAWLKVRLVGAASNRDAVGAKVRVNATIVGTTRWQRRDISDGSVLGDNNNPIAHFGLGDATNVATLRVEWPSGQVTELHNVAVRQHLTITEAPGLRAAGFAQGAMQLQLTAHLGMSISLDTSSDLVQWTPWQTWPQTNRIMTVTDPDASQHPYRFYKARAQ